MPSVVDLSCIQTNVQTDIAVKRFGLGFLYQIEEQQKDTWVNFIVE
jgi:hypothetical protein